MANEWNKTAFVEFETMLRRHLRSGAAPVAACAGFDLDVASAYLEGALGGPHLASYESHLAGCAICRRHLIELARLAQAAPSFEAQPAAEPVRIPARDRLKETLAGWFDLSTWNLKWRIVGGAGVAFATLIAAFGAQSFYHASNRTVLLSSKASSNSSFAVAEQVGIPLPSPTIEPSALVATTVAEESVANHSAPSRAPVPAPAIGPKENAPVVTVPASRGLVALSLEQPGEAPGAPKPGAVEARQSLPPQPRNFIQVNELTRTGESGLGEFGGGSSQLAANETTQDPRHIPRYQPSLVGGSLGSRLNAPADKRSKLRVLPEIKLWSFTEIAKRAIAPFSKSDSDTESVRKARPDKQEAPDDGALKPMQIMIRDKIFCFEKCKGDDLEKIRGMWIDREYDFEKQKWNIWTLTRDSEAYKQVLRDEPVLKEFFDHGPILIVWKNRVYKVLK
jgi:putative zinc finger protein